MGPLPCTGCTPLKSEASYPRPCPPQSPLSFALFRHQKETGRAAPFGIGNPPSKGNAHVIDSIIPVSQEFLPARRGKLLFPPRAGLRQLGQPYPRHQRRFAPERSGTRIGAVRAAGRTALRNGSVGLSGQPLRQQTGADRSSAALSGRAGQARSGLVDRPAHAGALPVRHHGQPMQHRRQHTGSRRRTALQPQYHGVVPWSVVAGRILRRTNQHADGRLRRSAADAFLHHLCRHVRGARHDARLDAAARYQAGRRKDPEKSFRPS